MRSHLAGWCLGLAAALVVGTAGADDSVALRRAEGGASYRFHEKLPWKEASDRVKIGAQVRCGGDCEVVLDGGSAVAFAEQSEIVIESPRFTKLGAAVARKVEAVRLARGRATVRQSGEVPLLLLAGDSEVVLRGGSVTVVAGDDRVALAVDGDLALRQGRALRDLPSGKVVILSDGSVDERDLPTPPRFRKGSHRPLALAADGPEGTVGLAWEAAPQATAMRIEVAEDDAFTRIVKQDTVGAQSGQAQIRLREGAYHVRIASLDRDGFVSPPSAPLPVRVMRVALPDGGLIPEPGTVVLPQGSSIRLLSAEGLEMSLGKRGFVPATREIPLAASKAELRLRVKGAPATESLFALEARALRAEVTMAPFAPIWPQDSVEVRVELVDPRGHYDLDRLEPRLRVYLENEEIFVTWTKKDGAHRAVIHGRRIDGPRLLRVQVGDGVGRALGTGLVEVVSSR